MKMIQCIDCGKELIVKKSPPPMRCRLCYLKYHRRNSPLQCVDCGKLLNPKSPRITRRCRFCFIKSHSTKFKEPSYDDAFGNWLAGFTDGEGNFHRTKRHGQCFRINLREDDKSILEEVRERLGCGVIYFLNKSQNNPNQRDQYQFTVASLVDLANIIIPFFENYKLRAKKRLDYLIWKKEILTNWKEVKRGG